MTMGLANGVPYRGPVVCLTAEEVDWLEANLPLAGSSDEPPMTIRDKIKTQRETSDKLKTPPEDDD